MAVGVNRGEIWRLRRPHPDKRRPVVVISRSSLIPLLHTVIVAPVTSTLRGTPTEVPVGVEVRSEAGVLPQPVRLSALLKDLRRPNRDARRGVPVDQVVTINALLGGSDRRGAR